MASRFDQILDAFWSQLNDPSVTRVKERRNLATNKAIPAITFIGLGASITPPDQVGEGKIIDPGAGTESRGKHVRLRAFNIFMVVQGQTEEQAEQLQHNAIAAWELACSGSIDFSEEDWPEQQEGNDHWTRRGHAITCSLTVQLPVYANPKPLVRVSSWGEDGIFTQGAFYGDLLGSGAKYNAGEIVC